MPREYRSRTWSIIVYPESLPENWLQILEELCVPAFVSPLHDSDVEEGTGEPKKPHYHIMLMYSGMQTQSRVKEVSELLGGALPQGVRDPRSMARYLCHLDQPSKHRYDTADVLQIGGADYLSMIASPSDKYQQIAEMIDFCQQRGIYEYCDLVDYARANNSDWFRCLCDNGTYVVKEYLKSASWKRKGVKNGEI